MRWPPWSPDSERDRDDKKRSVSWVDSLNATDWSHYSDPRTLIPTILLTTTILVSVRLYHSYLRRIPEATHIRPGFFRKRSLFGTVTRVGDADNFHLFHTPGGRLAGWGWLPGRRIPEKKTDLKGNTVCFYGDVQSLFSELIPCLDSRPPCRCGRAGSSPFWKTPTTILRRGSRMAEELHLESKSTGLYLQTRSIRTSCCHGLGEEVSFSPGCGEGNAEGRASYGV
jgi:hypothetical protein